MKPYRTDHSGEANYNSWTALPSGSIDGAYRQDNGRHFARLVHIASSDVTLGGGGGGGDLTSPDLTVLSASTIALTAGAVTLGTINPAATIVRIAFTGSGDVRLTYDGTTPVGGTTGEVWFKGGSLVVNATIASTIKVIKDTTTNSSLYVTQFG